MTNLFQQANLESGCRFRVYTAATTPSLGTDTIDLSTSYPGYNARPSALAAQGGVFEQGAIPKLPREVIYIGGALDVALADDSEETLPSEFAAVPLAIAPKVIRDSSTATAVLVVW